MKQAFAPLLVCDGGVPNRVLRTVLRSNPGPLLVVRADSPPSRIVVASSLRRPDQTLAWGALLGSLLRTLPLLVHAVAPQDTFWGGTHFSLQGVTEPSPEELLRLTRDRVEALTGSEDPPAVWRLRFGTPQEVCVTTAKTWGAELVVVGRHEDELLFPWAETTSEQLAVAGPWSLLVLPSNTGETA